MMKLLAAGWLLPLIALAVLPLAAGCKNKSAADGTSGDFVVTRVSGDGGVVNIEARAKEEGKTHRITMHYDDAVGGWRKCTFWQRGEVEFRTRKGGHCDIKKVEVQKSGMVVAQFSMEVTGMEKNKDSLISGRLEASGSQGFSFRRQFGF